MRAIPCFALALLASVPPASAQSTTGFGQTEQSLDYTRGARIVCGRGYCQETSSRETWPRETWPPVAPAPPVRQRRSAR